MKRQRSDPIPIPNAKRLKTNHEVEANTPPTDQTPDLQDNSGDSELDERVLAQSVLDLLKSEVCRPNCSMVEKVLYCATKILQKESNVLKLSSPITCVGDIHAEWYDLKKVFELSGELETGSRFIFLGDYVDRGSYGVECLVSLAARKILYPNDLFLIRGNHEDAMISSIYGHKRECEVYYSLDVFQASCEFFTSLPLCATVDEKYFCCHGGIPFGVSLAELEKLDRTIPYIDTLSQPQGTIADLLWSDPGEDTLGDVVPNSTRGCGSLFNENALDKWHQENNIILTVRAHQLAKEGVFWQFNKKLVTVFSASDYCRQMGNDGGILLLKDNEEPKGVTWTCKEVGVRKKIFGREIVASILFQGGLDFENSDSSEGDSSDEDWGGTGNGGSGGEKNNWVSKLEQALNQAGDLDDDSDEEDEDFQPDGENEEENPEGDDEPDEDEDGKANDDDRGIQKGDTEEDDNGDGGKKDEEDKVEDNKSEEVENNTTTTTQEEEEKTTTAAPQGENPKEDGEN